MPRKQSKTERQAIEARRRTTDAARVTLQRADDTAARVARILVQIEQENVAYIRRTLAEAAQRKAAQELLQAALAKTDEFAWKPWGLLAADPPTQELPLVRPAVPQLRLIHSKPRPAPRARDRFPIRTRELVAA